VDHQRADRQAAEGARRTRARAADRFAEAGLPTTRDESWRFTPLKTLADTAFGPVGATASDVTEPEVRESEIDMDVAARLVIVNGAHPRALSDAFELPTGVVVCPMSRALTEHRDLVEPIIAKGPDAGDDAFDHLNAALMDEGVFVHIPAGLRVEAPIVVRHLATQTPDAPNAKHPRSVIIVEEGAEATIVEHFAARSDDDVYLTNARTDIVAADRARVAHYFIERESEAATCVCTRRITAGEKTDVESHSVLLGGALIRNNVRPSINGENAHVVLNGVYVTRGDQHVDNTMRVEHNAPNCNSRQFFKGLLGGESRGVFTGRIIVDRVAQKTDAIQSSQTLLLSDEIYADDVRCTHGATIGQLDDEAMFYLRARGLTPEQARAALVQAFARENVERMALAPVRRWLTERVLRRLPGAELVLASIED